MPRTWTQHVSQCGYCRNPFRVSQETIDEVRRDCYGTAMTDAEIAASLTICLRCTGEEHEEERVRPTCDGCHEPVDAVTPTRIIVDGVPSAGDYCADCRERVESGWAERTAGIMLAPADAPTPPAGKRYPVTSAESQAYIDAGEWPDAAAPVEA